MSNDIKMTDEDWQKFKSLTEKEIERAIASDPDAQTPDDGNGVWLSEWKVNGKSEEIILPLSIDKNIVKYLTEHHIDYQSFLSGVLRAYVESQQKL